MSNRKMGGVARFKVYPGGDVTTECPDCGLVMDVPQRLFPEERAVIEAAVDWLRSADRRNGMNHIQARYALGTAVQALQEARDEG